MFRWLNYYCVEFLFENKRAVSLFCQLSITTGDMKENNKSK